MSDIYVNSVDVNELRLLEIGDQIAVEGNEAGIQYFHHGIYLGPTVGVADFGGDNVAEAKPRIVDLFNFTDYCKRRLIKIVYAEGKCLPVAEVLENANKLVDCPQNWGAYSIMTNNCEHFATYCKLGVAYSPQVVDKVKKSIKGLVIAGSSLISLVGSGLALASGISMALKK